MDHGQETREMIIFSLGIRREQPDILPSSSMGILGHRTQSEKLVPNKGRHKMAEM